MAGALVVQGHDLLHWPGRPFSLTLLLSLPCRHLLLGHRARAVTNSIESCVQDRHHRCDKPVRVGSSFMLQSQSLCKIPTTTLGR